MDFSDSTKVVFSRIQQLEPENVSKIIGYLLLQDHGEREMIRLAFGPDNLIFSLINKAKTELGLSKPSVCDPVSPSQVNQAPVSEIPQQFPSFAPASVRPNFPPATLIAPNPHWDQPLSADQQILNNADLVQKGYPDLLADDFHIQNQLQLMSLEDPMDSTSSVSSDYANRYYYPEPALGLRPSHRSPSLPEFPVKICHYFNKGFCKHGSNCKYFHGQPSPDSFPQNVFSSNSNDFHYDDHAISPGSLEKLEMEITELLRSRRGCPVSIASLPMMYYEKYGRSLQAEGYLTESQRHGKTGYSLTKLLARLKNSIRLLDR